MARCHSGCPEMTGSHRMSNLIRPKLVVADAAAAIGALVTPTEHRLSGVWCRDRPGFAPQRVSGARPARPVCRRTVSA